MAISLEMLKSLRDIDCPSHITRFMETRNAMFLKNDLISESDGSWNFVLERDHLNMSPPISSDRFIVVHNMPTVQTHLEPSIIKIPQVDYAPVDLDV